MPGNGSKDCDWDDVLREYKAGSPSAHSVTCVQSLVLDLAGDDLLLKPGEVASILDAVLEDVRARVTPETPCIVRLVLEITADFALGLDTLGDSRRENVEERLANLTPPRPSVDEPLLAVVFDWIDRHVPQRANEIASLLGRHLDPTGASDAGKQHHRVTARRLESLGITEDALRELGRDLVENLPKERHGGKDIRLVNRSYSAAANSCCFKRHPCYPLNF